MFGVVGLGQMGGSVAERLSAGLLKQFELMVLVSDAHFHWVKSADEIMQLAGEIADGAPLVVWEETPVVVWEEAAGDAGVAEIPGPQERTLGVVTAQCGVAETGSVLLVEESRQQMLHSLLSQELLVLVHAEDVVAALSETADLVADACAKGKPVTFLSGPSRTGDIELRHVSGIQGPCEVHVALCDFPRLASEDDVR